MAFTTKLLQHDLCMAPTLYFEFFVLFGWHDANIILSYCAKIIICHIRWSYKTNKVIMIVSHTNFKFIAINNHHLKKWIFGISCSPTLLFNWKCMKEIHFKFWTQIGKHFWFFTHRIFHDKNIQLILFIDDGWLRLHVTKLLICLIQRHSSQLAYHNTWTNLKSMDSVRSNKFSHQALIIYKSIIKILWIHAFRVYDWFHSMYFKNDAQ